MPARTIPFRAAAHVQGLASGCPGRAPADCTRPTQRRLFHGGRALGDEIDDKNHYETLNVQTNASAADIKKSFYSLSKTHHPDHNRADPHASRRFMRISEAYTTLSHTTTRAKYDRDVLRLHDAAHHHQHPHAARTGSYHSSGPVGARPASGLSRRRGTFRGPPPSFFRSGGWGSHSAKRGAAHAESTGGGGGQEKENRPPEELWRAYTNSSSSKGGGMGPGQEPYGRGAAAGEVPHFGRDAKAAHTRTQAHVDEARARARRAQREGGFAFPGARSDFSEVGSFFAVVGVLGVAIGIPYLAVRLWSNGGGRGDKKKIKKISG
ncbi:unnamed protein product [Discula destructiva]